MSLYTGHPLRHLICSRMFRRLKHAVSSALVDGRWTHQNTGYQQDRKYNSTGYPEMPWLLDALRCGHHWNFYIIYSFYSPDCVTQTYWNWMDSEGFNTRISLRSHTELKCPQEIRTRMISSKSNPGKPSQSSIVYYFRFELACALSLQRRTESASLRRFHHESVSYIKYSSSCYST